MKTPGVIFLFVASLLLVSVAAGQDRVDFNFDVKPILSDRCYICHGPDAENREADLRLDTKEGAFAESQSGELKHVIKAGSLSESELIRRIISTEPEVVMPPPGSKLSLQPEEVGTLKRWVKEGAEWKDHWAFIPLRDRIPVPLLRDSTWPKNDIDHFVLRKLNRTNLGPTNRASRERLLRRVTFDLTGLPPTLEELDAFLADNSDNAFERVIERLLASKAYGERMTSEWLDVARYSDTYGYQVDRDRYVWPWRDWVIRAFNDNMPYDKFVTHQLAGDLVPNADKDTILATTFNRLHPQKVEGGSVPEEFRVEYVADRTQTFSTAFLGLTMECAKCHDHKYDPLKLKEYFQLFAFFNNIDEAGLYSYFTPSIPTPTLMMGSDDIDKRLANLKQKEADEIEDNTMRLNALSPASRRAYQDWLATSPKIKPLGQIAYLNCDQRSGANSTVPGKVSQALKLTGDDAVGTKVGNFKRYEPFSVSLWINTPDLKKRAVIFHRSRAWTDAASRGYQLLLEDGRLSASLIHFWPGNAIRVRAKQPVPIAKWAHVTMTYNGSSRAAGLRLYVDGEAVETEVVRDNLYKNITGGGGDNIAIGQRFRDNGFKNGLVDEFRVFNRRLTQIEITQIATGKTIDLKKVPREQLLEYYRSVADKQAIELAGKIKSLRKEISELQNRTTEIMVMRELAKPRETFVLARGAYDAPTDRVSAGTPEVFSPFDNNLKRDRLGLTKWMFTKNHPLTSRVIVNRYWQLLFGEGLVRTPEDFGSQGALPTHPDLLDWLARDFIDGGWDIKRLLKQIVLSSTYQQDSTVTRALLDQDPENELLARFPGYRLSAEMIRDNALAQSGLLVRKIGGPPARPYEVEVSFKPAKRDKGAGLYRRSLYTYWKRTGPAPVMMTLDASKREVCRVKRERTSSPLQAFVMLNGPQFVEAARALSQRLLEKQNDERLILRDLFRTLTSRLPSDKEQQVLQDLLNRQKEEFAANPDRVDSYLKEGDFVPGKIADKTQLAAFTVVANTLLGLDEALMKR